MTRTRRLLLALPLLTAVASCGDKDATPDSERKTAAGEVLGGTISDDMLPLDTVTSQSPPLRESASSADSGKDESSAKATDAPTEEATKPAAPPDPADAPSGE